MSVCVCACVDSDLISCGRYRINTCKDIAVKIKETYSLDSRGLVYKEVLMDKLYLKQ